VNYSVSDTEHLSTTKDLLLRHAKRQLYYSGLYYQLVAPEIGEADPGTNQPSQELLSLLQNITLFESLQPDQLVELAAHIKSRCLEPGEVLFAQGGVEATLFVVVSGILQISQHTEQSGQQTVGSIGAGDYIGEVSLLTGAPYAATATARTHCKLYGLDCNVIKGLLGSNSDLYAEFDRSARRGLAILNRGVAVSATDDSARHSLLHRIRTFFDDPR
jgi:CRP-like cAMP-binding protein